MRNLALIVSLTAGLGPGCSPSAPADPHGIAMVAVSPGEFAMGGARAVPGYTVDEGSADVEIRRPYRLATTEVTRAQYAAVTGEPAGGVAEDEGLLPVGELSWFAAVDFCNTLSTAQGLRPVYEIAGEHVTWRQGADGYRLPTEAEWEYAARAGEGHPFAGSGDVEEVAWYSGNSEYGPHPVATLGANAWGFHDLSGNAREWVWDRYGPYPTGSVADPVGPEDGALRVIRGGGWDGIPLRLRVNTREAVEPGYSDAVQGLRLARNGD